MLSFLLFVLFFFFKQKTAYEMRISGWSSDVCSSDLDRLLAEAGSDKSKILMAQIFVANMKEFDGMNQAWDAWVAPGNAPPRATVEARLANPDFKEIGRARV